MAVPAGITKMLVCLNADGYPQLTVYSWQSSAFPGTAMLTFEAELRMTARTDIRHDAILGFRVIPPSARDETSLCLYYEPARVVYSGEVMPPRLGVLHSRDWVLQGAHERALVEFLEACGVKNISANVVVEQGTVVRQQLQRAPAVTPQSFQSVQPASAVPAGASAVAPEYIGYITTVGPKPADME